MKIISHAEQRREEWRVGVETRMLISAENGALQLCIFEQWVAPAMGAPTHSHRVEEVLSVVTGKAEIWIDNESVSIIEGQSLVVPANRKHRFRNVGSEILHIYAVLASSIFEAAFDHSEPVRRWLPSAAD
ncbi:MULTISPECIES: cupin domain-containing protein [unclassified Mesorhizobium]|uniref:cupin domain-containing protein n=1 Tax=unclassified Mesorhizobium TaxID=325217 RepID=UPI0003CE82D5|nr:MULTISPECIES: cupin domain-containing protein [unclassified Mesorhizobium]ESY54302.1 cupin [Mesorhizobium sp. LNJC374B00]ESY58342.1 cupin [Mesorhizobium sp. LNJC372A00]WJI78805.1 cupin domain-containing protein [Mesorhizobium sp. C374B]WJI85340.1 cupin domain-containing protein [Mesorhizobium sp. C372A]